MKKFLTVPCLIFAAAALFGCRSVPVSDRTQLMLTTTSYENELGATAYAQYKQEYKQSTNTQYNQALERCGKAIAAVAGQEDFNWEFVVLESDEQNAFCLPGGKVAVYSGIMDIMENEAELACVVGHEIGHAIARHSGEQLSWGYLQSLGGYAVASIWSDENVNTIYGVGTQLGMMLPFSRSNESEADYIGLMLMAKAGYDPQAALAFWSRFGTDSGFLEKFLSTHPGGAERIADITAALPEAEKLYTQCADKKGLGVTFNHSK